MNKQLMKKCPFCAEEILADAKKCKHCGEILDQTLIKGRGESEENKPTNNKSWRPKGCLGWIFFIFIVLPIAIVAWPATLVVLTIWLFLKQSIERRKKILKFAGVILSGLVLIAIAGRIFFPEEFSKESNQRTISPTPTLTPSPTPEEEGCSLRANIRYSDTQLEITNSSEVDWQDVTIEINSGVIRGGYSYAAPLIEAGTTYTIGLARFSDSKGNRFNPFEKLVQNVYITEGLTLCDFYAETK